MTSPATAPTSHRVAVIRQVPRYNEAVVRDSVRRAVEALGISWKDVVRPGDRVILKPNFIRESHTQQPKQWEQIITHGTVIAAVAMEVASALDGRGFATVDLVKHKHARDIQIWMDVGKLEFLLEDNRRMSALLNQNGYNVTYREFSGGHNHTAWRDDVWRGLEMMFPQ